MASLDIRLANADLPVLIQGETGAGKDRVARFLHTANLQRRGGPLVTLNCGAIDPGTARSQLFGHVRGAFTGALRPRVGALKAADRGTLFLDEVAELSLELQASLLRVLESHEVTPVGGDRAQPTAFRLVAATHKDLFAEARTGRFRLDLYYRVAVLLARVPPLRERRAELSKIVSTVLADLGHRQVSLHSSALLLLRSHTWPGNIRELRNVLCRALVRAEDEKVIRAEHLQFDGPGVPRSGTEEAQMLARPSRVCRGDILDALRATGGNRTLAAKQLGIARSTLYAHLSAA